MIQRFRVFRFRLELVYDTADKSQSHMHIPCAVHLESH